MHWLAVVIPLAAVITVLADTPAASPSAAKNASGENAFSATPAHHQSIKVALYKGPGTAGNGPPDLMKQLNGANAKTSLVEVTPDEIRAGILTNFNVVIFAGGSGSKQGEALGEAGRAEVKQFVGNGGGYIGICAGAYLAVNGGPSSLHIINAKLLSPNWRRGKAVLEMQLTPAGAGILGPEKTDLEVLYHNGPVVGPAGLATMPPYEPLAYFRTEVASNDTPKGVMIGSPAIFSGAFKRGKVVCISPHPEQTAGLEYIISRAINWAAISAGGSQ